MTSLYPFIQGSLEWSFSELFSSDVSLWNQCKYIAFNIFSSRILIILHKMLIITWISNGKANELTIYTILCRNDTMFYRQKLFSLLQAQEKLKACRNSKENFTGSCFIADESHVKIVWLHAVVLIKDDIFHFRNNALWLYVIIMSRTIFRVNLHCIVCLNVKQLLAQSGRHIWSLSHSNEIRTHNHLVHKQALDSLAKMVE